MFGKEFRFDFETVKRCIEGCLQCCLEGFKTVKRVGNFTLSKCFRKENINQEIFGWWGAIFANFLALIGLLATILVIATFVRLIWNQKTLKKYLPISCIHQRHILITGCDYGFGFELACRLDKLGCPVFATCLTESGLKNILRNCSSRVQVLLLDVTRKETINAAFEIVSDVLKKKDKKGKKFSYMFLSCLSDVTAPS